MAESNAERRGAAYDLTNSPSVLVEVVERLPVSEGQKQGIRELLDVLNALYTDSVSNGKPLRVWESELIDAMSLTRSQLRYRLKPLIEAKVVGNTKERVPGKRSYNVFTFGTQPCLPTVVNAGATEVQADPPQQQILDFCVGRDSPLTSYKGEQFSVFTLLSALRLRSEPDAMSGRYTRTICIGNDKADIEVATETGRVPAAVTDLPVLTTIISMLHAEAKRGNLPPNGQIVIRLVDIVKHMGHVDGGSRRRLLTESLKRWKSTSFTLREITQAMQDRLGTIRVNRTLNLISAMDWIEQVTASGAIKTVVAVQLTLLPMLYERIAKDVPRELLSVHPETLVEQSPVKLLLYYWCRRAIKHQHWWMPFSLDHLRRELWPYMTRANSNKTLKRIYLQGLTGSRDDVSRPVAGYEMRIGAGQYSFRAIADDRLLGVNSFRAHKSGDELQ